VKRTSSLLLMVRLLLVPVAMAAAAPTFAANDAMLELMKILRDRGSLTNDEYELLVNAAKADTEQTEWAKQEVRTAVD
jgi:phosphate-selective porin OprO/OprP